MPDSLYEFDVPPEVVDVVPTTPSTRRRIFLGSGFNLYGSEGPPSQGEEEVDYSEGVVEVDYSEEEKDDEVPKQPLVPQRPPVERHRRVGRGWRMGQMMFLISQRRGL